MDTSLAERDITVNAVSLQVEGPCAPSRVADVVAYLLNEGGRGLTGQVIRVDDPGSGAVWAPPRR